VARVLLPKIHILTLKWKKQLKTNFEWALCDDKSTNKIHMKGCPSSQFFDIHVRVKKYQSNKK